MTHFDYSSQQPLQVIRTTDGYGTAQVQVTEYGYDALRRVITSTVGVGTALARTDTTTYNADNTIAKTIRNYQNGVFDSAHPDQDVITTYGYDGLGRPVWVRDALGRYDVTHYDAHGQVDWTARNLTPLQLDSQDQPIFQSYSTTAPDANVVTLYGYDGLGRTTLVTQTGILAGTFDPVNLRFSQSTTRVTRTEYDDQSRPVTTTLNYRPGLPADADTNIRLVTAYDAAGNVIWERDGLGYKTKTDYDALNRPVKITRNYENGNPLTVDFANQSWTDGSDTDLMTAIQYDQLGRVEREIDNYVDGIFSATEPITDRITLYQYDPLGRAIKTVRNYDPLTVNLQRDTNRTTTLAYHPQTTRLTAESDPASQWTTRQYDALGRLTRTIRNCRDATLNPAQQGCGFFFPTTNPDRNVPSETRYDALGRAYETVDPLGSITISTTMA